MAGRVLVALAITAIGGILAYFAMTNLTGPDINKSRQLVANGAVTEGRVTATFARDHGTVEYVYDVGDHTFKGGGSVSGENPRPEQLKPGDRIRVVYDRSHPEVSCACSPVDDLANSARDNTAVSAFAGLALGLVAFVGLTILKSPGLRQLNVGLP